MYQARFHGLKHFLILLALAISATANASLFGIGRTSWQEEVLLHDGGKVIADRTIVRGSGNRGSTYNHQVISFRHPTTGESILWEDNFNKNLGDSNFLPMALDIYDGAAYLVAKPMGCLSYNEWSRPNPPPYVVFKYQYKVWVRIPISELPVETKSPNLISSQPDTEVKQMGKHLIDAKTIQKFTSEFQQSHLRTILREPFPTASEGCSEMIKTNDGWEGLGFFKLKATYEACIQYCIQRDVNRQSCPCTRLFKATD